MLSENNINWGRVRLLNRHCMDSCQSVEYAEYIPPSFIPVSTDSYIEALRSFLFSETNTQNINVLANQLLLVIDSVGLGDKLDIVDTRKTYKTSQWNFVGTTKLNIAVILRGADIIMTRIKPVVDKIDTDVVEGYINAPSDLHKVAWLAIAVIYATWYYETRDLLTITTLPE